MYEPTSTAIAPGRHNAARDRKSTRLNSSHLVISYAVFCLKKKKHNALKPSTFLFFFFNDPATTEISPLSLHDALPIFARGRRDVVIVPRIDAHQPAAVLHQRHRQVTAGSAHVRADLDGHRPGPAQCGQRSEEHTSELQSPCNLVCRLLLEKKKTQRTQTINFPFFFF